MGIGLKILNQGTSKAQQLPVHDGRLHHRGDSTHVEEEPILRSLCDLQTPSSWTLGVQSPNSVIPTSSLSNSWPGLALTGGPVSLQTEGGGRSQVGFYDPYSYSPV